MEITGATSSAYDSSVERAKPDDKSSDAADADKAAAASADSVEISPEAARLAAREKDGEKVDGDESDKDDEQDDGKPSAPKSFVYGALGLERPEQTQDRATDGYDWGRWLAAGVTIGSIISVLI